MNKEFSNLIYRVINPAGLADSMAETAAWLKGERSADSRYWSQQLGHGAEIDTESRGSGQASPGGAR